MKYFAKFPKVFYSFDSDPSSLEIVTDVTFPVRILEKYAQDTKYYYTAIVKDGLKPEDVAYLVYGDVEKHWIVLQFNKIINPYFQWPLSSTNFDKYIIAKYGSIGAAQATVDTYYKIVTRVSDAQPDEPYVQKFEIGAAEYANVTVDLAGTDVQLQNGEVVKTLVDRSTISVYDRELQNNDARREIRLIQKTYVDAIVTSLNMLTNG